MSGDVFQLIAERVASRSKVVSSLGSSATSGASGSIVAWNKLSHPSSNGGRGVVVEADAGIADSAPARGLMRRKSLRRNPVRKTGLFHRCDSIPIDLCFHLIRRPRCKFLLCSETSQFSTKMSRT